MTTPALPLLDSFSALADATRCRMLWLLEQHELTVGELCAVLQLPQSTVSRHLKTLADAGWVTSRRDGTSRYYALAIAAASGHAELWELTRAQFAGRPGIEQDARRLAAVLARRGEASQRFFASSSGEWDRLRDELFGRATTVHALMALLPAAWTVGDLGCGTGAIVSLLAPHVRTVIGVDASDEMLAAARRRTASFPNVDLRRGSLEALPIAAATLDAALMVLVLHHLPSPVPALAEAFRALKPGARLLVVDMAPHEREEYRQQMGHVWLGFSEDQLRRFAEQAGFPSLAMYPLPPADEAKGPALFAAVAEKPEDARADTRA
ncbi:MAG: ArsR family transcriptional regulator [Acidobacteria bacterium]|nr:ArsR family transcriptional regulator [Acidobacteriota bacterium]